MGQITLCLRSLSALSSLPVTRLPPLPADQVLFPPWQLPDSSPSQVQVRAPSSVLVTLCTFLTQISPSQRRQLTFISCANSAWFNAGYLHVGFQRRSQSSSRSSRLTELDTWEVGPSWVGTQLSDDSDACSTLRSTGLEIWGEEDSEVTSMVMSMAGKGVLGVLNDITLSRWEAEHTWTHGCAIPELHCSCWSISVTRLSSQWEESCLGLPNAPQAPAQCLRCSSCCTMTWYAVPSDRCPFPHVGSLELAVIVRKGPRRKGVKAGIKRTKRGLIKRTLWLSFLWWDARGQ